MAAKRRKQRASKQASADKKRKRKKVATPTARRARARAPKKRAALRQKRAPQKGRASGGRTGKAGKKSARSRASVVRKPAKKTASRKQPKKVAKKAASRKQPKKVAPKRPAAKRPAAKRPAKKAAKKQTKRRVTPPRAPSGKVIPKKPTLQQVPKRVIPDVKREVASLLWRYHGIDEELTPKLVDTFEPEIVDWKQRGLTAADIAIKLAETLREEGVKFLGLRQTKPDAGVVVEQVESLRTQLVTMRQEVLAQKYEKGYSPPSQGTWGIMGKDGDIIGFSRYVPFAEVLTRENVDDFVREVMDAAGSVYAQQGNPNALFYTAIEMYEYGSEEAGSKKSVLFVASDAAMTYSYQGTRGVKAHELERTLRTKLKKIAVLPNAAVIIESISVKSYVP